MRFSQIVSETTTAGSISTVSSPLGATQTRGASIYGDQKVGSLLKGKKTNKPYANSLTEGKMKDLSMDLKDMSEAEFKKKYGKSKKDMREGLKNKPAEKVEEARLEEDDIILVPGQGRLKKTGFIKHDPDKAEKEGQTLKNSLHTIIRVATHLDKELSVRDNFPEWVSEKIGAVKSNMVTVMDYLISAKEMQTDPDAMQEMTGGVIAGGPQYEGAKVDRMVKHITKSEKKLGHSKKEAENIAWATANKRGMLDNKNKKK